MNLDQLTRIEDIERFLDGSQAVIYAVGTSKDERYKWVQTTLVRLRYYGLTRREKGVVLKFIAKITGYSRQQVTRLVAQYKATGRVRRKVPAVNNGFQKRYSNEDIRLLVELDKLHGTPSGPAAKKLCERAYKLHGETEYEALSHISVSHLYNLRKAQCYRQQSKTYAKTQARQVNIGERRKPITNGEPGYLRVDTVHQGDLDGEKGVYHINAVDEETQFQVVCSVSKISEAYLVPVLRFMLEAFPYSIKGFHSDNGSEYINKTVASLLEKLRVEFTKSRSRKTNDNALVESKNGAVIRKIFGHTHIAQKWAPELNEFNYNHLIPYINFHRPCYFAQIKIDEKGKQRKKYPYEAMMTPYEKLKSLEDADKYLKEGITFDLLDQVASAMSDSEAARKMNEARDTLFGLIFEQNEARA